MSLNLKQVLSIVVAILSVLAVSTAQLTDIVGPSAAKITVSIAGLLNTILASALAAISSQTGLVKDVQAMPGVEKIVVNADANKTLATIAVDPQSKVEATPETSAAVEDIAKGNV